MTSTKEHLLNNVNKCDGSVATTNPSDLSTLDEPSLTILINHYRSVAEKLPDNLQVRDRLVELQQELLNRTTTNE